MSPPIADVLNFLCDLFHANLGYSALNTARSALSTFVLCDGRAVGSHPLVVRFMKGVFNLRPALPRNNVTWDVNIVLEYISKMGSSENLSLKDLSLKVNMLLRLLGSQRTQTTQLLHLDNITCTYKDIRIRIGDVTKSTRPGKHVDELFYPAFNENVNICVVKALQTYLDRTAPIRRSRNLFVSYIQPHDIVGRNTLSRWTKELMIRSGIDMSIFTPHSTRAAAASAAALAKVPVATILKTAGWSNVGTFATFYKKPIIQNNFSQAILKSV